MRIAIAAESDPGEPRVAATPETVKKFKTLGAEVVVARGAGVASGISDADYEAAGATVGDNVGKDADLVLKVQAGRRPKSSPVTRRARWSSPSWTRTATRPRSSRWRMPG